MSSTWIIIISISLITLSTILGSAFIFFLKKPLSRKGNALLLGLAAGVMTAASIFELILPSLSDAEESWGKWSFVPVTVGFIGGILLLFLIDHLVPHFHNAEQSEEGIHPEKYQKSFKLFMAMGIHNLPEGMAVGLALGAALKSTTLTIYGGLALAIGIALQNIPEGLAVSLSMYEAYGSKKKGFLMGLYTALVEPVGAVIALFFGQIIGSALPWILPIAAGAMMYVVVEELIPSSKLSEHDHTGAFAILTGFIIMMIVSIALK
jgi:ZIP family zinc transporter